MSEFEQWSKDSNSANDSLAAAAKANLVSLLESRPKLMRSTLRMIFIQASDDVKPAVVAHAHAEEDLVDNYLRLHCDELADLRPIITGKSLYKNPWGLLRRLSQMPGKKRLAQLLAETLELADLSAQELDDANLPASVVHGIIQNQTLPPSLLYHIAGVYLGRTEQAKNRLELAVECLRSPLFLQGALGSARAKREATQICRYILELSSGEANAIDMLTALSRV